MIREGAKFNQDIVFIDRAHAVYHDQTPRPLSFDEDAQWFRNHIAYPTLP